MLRSLAGRTTAPGARFQLEVPTVMLGMAAKARSQTRDLGTLDPRDAEKLWTPNPAYDLVTGFNKEG
jgi:hypothetical protein